MGGETVSLLDAGTLQGDGPASRSAASRTRLAWGRDGRLFVANSGSNSVSVIRGNGAVTETVKTSLSTRRDPVGSTPDALALSPDGKRLYVANADNNDVAVIDTSDPERVARAGLYPDRLVSQRPGDLRPTAGRSTSARARA